MTEERRASYDEAFSDLQFVYLEDSWVLWVTATSTSLSFELDAVLTPEHPSYHAPRPGEQYCYRRANLTLTSETPIRFVRSAHAGTEDATGEVDFGNIDSFSCAGESTWELEGEWGNASVTRPSVVVTYAESAT